VREARQERTVRLIEVSLWGIGVRAGVVAAELAAVWWTASSALLVDAIATIADVAATLGLVGAIKLAERPPDRDHPFGHGRYEPLAGLQLGTLIVFLGVALGVSEAISLVRGEAAGRFPLSVVIVPAVAAVLLEVTCRMVLRRGRAANSSALVAEAYHYRIDAITSLLAAVGLTLAAVVPEYSRSIDHAFAFLLAAIMAWLGGLACRENMHQLLDRIPHEDRFDRVRDSALKVKGVRDVEKVRIQHAGPDAHVDIDVEVDPQLSVEEAHVITQHVRARIQSDWPSVRDVVVHVEPHYAGDH
jgi:cation diffusion facilitator family transporter